MKVLNEPETSIVMGTTITQETLGALQNMMFAYLL